MMIAQRTLVLFKNCYIERNLFTHAEIVRCF